MAIVKWDNKWYVRSFALASNGMGNEDIARSLGIPPRRFARWITEDDALRDGLEEARKPKTGYADFKAFIYEKLPRKVKELWDELDAIRSLPRIDRTRSERRKAVLELIDLSAPRHQQALFLHALIKCNFISNNACLETGISPGTVEGWCRNDEKFRRLVEGIHEFKGDFYESCLVDLCRQGDSAAIIFANKTANRKRGYAPELNINTNSESVVRHEVSVEDLPTDAKRAVLAAIRAKNVAQLEDNSRVQDAEIVPPS